MAIQLVLLDNDTNQYRLDDKTREIGRAGVAAARRILAEAANRAA